MRVAVIGLPFLPLPAFALKAVELRPILKTDRLSSLIGSVEASALIRR